MWDWRSTGSPSPAEIEHRQITVVAKRPTNPGVRRSHGTNLPGGYDLTVETSLAVVRRLLSGMTTPGFQTPAMAFGPDIILEVGDVTRTDESVA